MSIPNSVAQGDGAQQYASVAWNASEPQGYPVSGPMVTGGMPVAYSGPFSQGGPVPMQMYAQAMQMPPGGDMAAMNESFAGMSLQQEGGEMQGGMQMGMMPEGAGAWQGMPIDPRALQAMQALPPGAMPMYMPMPPGQWPAGMVPSGMMPGMGPGGEGEMMPMMMPGMDGQMVGEDFGGRRGGRGGAGAGARGRDRTGRGRGRRAMPGGPGPAEVAGAGGVPAPGGVAPGVMTADVMALMSLAASLNPPRFDIEEVPRFRCFIIKSFGEDDVHRSIKYSVWSSTQRGNEKLQKAFEESGGGMEPIFLLFSVNASGQFCGMAQMVGPVEQDNDFSLWTAPRWKGQFRVQWIFVKDVPNRQFRDIKLPNNESRELPFSRDAQEVPMEQARVAIARVRDYYSATSLLMDFPFYEQREGEMAQRRARGGMGGGSMRGGGRGGMRGGGRGGMGVDRPRRGGMGGMPGQRPRTVRRVGDGEAEGEAEGVEGAVAGEGSDVVVESSSAGAASGPAQPEPAVVA